MVNHLIALHLIRQSHAAKDVQKSIALKFTLVNLTSGVKKKKKCLSEKGQTKNLLKGTKAASESPNSGHFETNINAIDWHIVSPEGKEYKFRNLNLWAEKNYALFGFDNIKEAPKVSAGIQSAKRGAEGKIKTNTYKGWRVIIDSRT